MEYLYVSCQLLTFCAIFASYCYTIQKGIPGGDAGELVAEACLHGTAHPPGYPLFSMLTSMSTKLLPFQPAVSANLASAFFGAWAGVFIFKSVVTFISKYNVYSLSGEKMDGIELYGAATLASFYFAFSNLTWLYSIGAEVFALNNLLSSWIVYLAVQYTVRRDSKNMYPSYIASQAALICGLSLTNQHTAVFYVLVIAFVVAYDVLVHPEFCSGSTADKKSVACWQATEVLKLSGFAILGLLPYIYLPLAAQNPQKGSWGDSSTLTGFFTHIFRMEYGTFSLSPAEFKSEGLLERLQYYASDAIFQFSYLGCAMTLVGASFCIYLILFQGRKNQAPMLLLAMFFVYIIVFHSLSNLPLDKAMPFEVHRRFWMQPNIILCVWIGIGFAHTMNVAQYSIVRCVSRSVKARNAVTTQYFMFGLYMLLSVETAHRWSEQYFLMHDMYGQGALGNYFEKHGISTLESVPQNALLVSFTDLNWNSIRYLQACEKRRLDVVHLNFQIMPFPWFSKIQTKLYNSSDIVFPKIDYNSASMQKGTKGHAKIITEFFLANLNHKSRSKRKIFVDLHAIGFDQFQAVENVLHGLHYIPYGNLWQVKRFKSFRYNVWKKKNSQVMKNMDRILLPLPTKEDVLKGSWEEGCAATYIDGLYQTAIFQLEIAIHMNVQNAKDAVALKKKQAKVFFHALFFSFEHLQRILKIVKTSPSNLRMADVYKNAALAASRMTTAMAWIDKVNSKVLPFNSGTKIYPSYPKPEVNDIIVRSRNTIQLYLKHAANDPDAPVFRNHLKLLNSILSAGKTSQGPVKPERNRQRRGTKRRLSNVATEL